MSHNQKGGSNWGGRGRGFGRRGGNAGRGRRGGAGRGGDNAAINPPAGPAAQHAGGHGGRGGHQHAGGDAGNRRGFGGRGEYPSGNAKDQRSTNQTPPGPTQLDSALYRVPHGDYIDQSAAGFVGMGSEHLHCNEPQNPAHEEREARLMTDPALLEVVKVRLAAEQERSAAKEKASQLQNLRKKDRADFDQNIRALEEVVVRREAAKWQKLLDQAVADAVADEQAKTYQKIKHAVACAAKEFKKIPDAEITRLRLQSLQHQIDESFQLATAEAANAEAAANAAEAAHFEAAAIADEQLVDDLREDERRDAARAAAIRRAREERKKKEEEDEDDIDMEEHPRCDVNLE